MTTTPKIEPRKPRSVQAAAGFISGSAHTVDPPDAAAIEPSPVAAKRAELSMGVASGGRKATMSRRRSGKTVRQLTVYLEPDIEKQLRVVAVEEDRLPSDVIADALRAFFARR